MKDTLYKSSSDPVKPFEFNKRVVEVFPDMIERSVPGYPLTISMISVMADHYIQDKTNVYDLGCSLGAVSFAIQQGVKDKKYQVIAIDNSQAMIDACYEKVQSDNIEFVLDDVLNVLITNASFVVMNFTLQFIPLEQRSGLLKKIYQGLNPGGALILSEKILFDEQSENRRMNELHHHMKELNGYDRMEIASKRDALDNVLMPESIETHEGRLIDSGFNNVSMWLKCLNFASFITVK